MVGVSTIVEVYLDDFDDDDLIEELEGRGYYVSEREESRGNTSLEDLYISWTLDRDQFEEKFRDYCRQNLGRSF